MRLLELRKVCSSAVGSDGRTDETSSDQPPSDQVGLHASTMVDSVAIGSIASPIGGAWFQIRANPTIPNRLPISRQTPPIGSAFNQSALRSEQPEREPIFFLLPLLGRADIIHPSFLVERKERRKSLFFLHYSCRLYEQVPKTV